MEEIREGGSLLIEFDPTVVDDFATNRALFNTIFQATNSQFELANCR